MKRRPKSHPLLTIPRGQAHAALVAGGSTYPQWTQAAVPFAPDPFSAPGAAASSSLERSKEMVGQRGVEVDRDGERPGSQAERPHPADGGGQWAEFGDRPALTGDNETLPSLDPVEEAGGIPLQVLQADGTHEIRYSRLTRA